MSRLRAIALLSFLTGATAFAQESSGSVTGIVTDPSGAPVAAAQVAVVNRATGVKVSAATNSAGNYVLLYLIPGDYTLFAEHEGFRKMERSGIAVRVGDELKVDLQLALGDVKQTVQVEASTPLLESENADVGDTMNQAQIKELPLADGNPFILARLTAGTVFTGDPKMTRPFDNGDVSAIRVNGAEGGNNFSLNGMSNTAKQIGYNNVVAFVPPSDAVQEFRVVTSSYNALSGSTAGANINLSTKSGTNQLHGTAYEFFRNELLSANDFFLNRSGQPRAVVRYNRFGGSLGGPVLFPKLYNGRNKTFFLFTYENLPDVFPEPGTFTVPTVGERKGDFSGLPATNIIYDPLTAATTTPGHVARTPFPGNIIPSSRFSPITTNFMQYFPLPNTAGRADGTNNFVSQQSRYDHFHSYLGRVDQSLGDRQRLSGTYYTNNRNEDRFGWAGNVSGIRPSGQELFLINYGGGLDDTIILSPTTVLKLVGGLSRLQSRVGPAAPGSDPAQLGFSSNVLANFTGPRYLPPFNIAGFSRLEHNTGGNIDRNLISNIYSFQPRLTNIHGGHKVDFGYDLRKRQENYAAWGAAEGYYDFQTNYTRATDSSSSLQGQGFAAFLLGQTTSENIDRNGTRSDRELLHALYANDEWKVMRRLTITLGLRWEYEGPVTEMHDQNTRGMDLTDANPFSAAAIAAFAKAFPMGLVVQPGQPVLTPANFQVLGGYLYADPSHHSFWNPQMTVFLPRAGFAYQLDARTVIRGGWGIYAVPTGLAGTNNAGINQPGYSQNTSVTPSNDNGLTFQANIANPFPYQILNPVGSALGMGTAVGTSVTNYPVNPTTGRSQSWSVGFQRQLPGRWVVDASYVGRRGYDLSRSSNYLDAVPAAYLSTSPFRDNATISALTKTVTNPFYGVSPGTNYNNVQTVQVMQLLRPFPQFTGISTPLYNGSNIYHSGELRVERRFSKGFLFWGTYTWSKLIERYGFQNDFQLMPTKQVSGNDIPHRVTATFVYELPFGKGRLIGSNWHGLLNQALGGWQTAGILQVQSGEPLGMGNIVYFGDPSKLRTDINSNTLNHAFDTSLFYFTDAAVSNPQTGAIDPNLQRTDARISLANNIRTFPANLPNFRGEGQNNIDLSLLKKLFIRETRYLECRGEFLNAFNHPWFSNPNTTPTNAAFATITSQRNQPRQVQVAMKLVF